LVEKTAPASTVETAMRATLFFTVTGPMLRAPAFVAAMALLAVASVALLLAVFALRPRTAFRA